ncbi:MAG: hypothetical protein ACAI43_25490 [Phycisphaerae bacterium]|nr:hypothetical protein [Tepidisphaeraceae bacterium]
MTTLALIKTQPQAPRPMASPGPRAGPPAIRRRPLTFASLAWLKLQFLLYAGETEVGAFGVTAEHDPLYVEDVVTVAQRATANSITVDDASLADHYAALERRGVPRGRCGRVWIRLRPGTSPDKHDGDDAAFAEVTRGCDWAVRCVVGRTGRPRASLRYTVGPGAELPLAVAVDWTGWSQLVRDNRHPERSPSPLNLIDAWADEYGRNVAFECNDDNVRGDPVPVGDIGTANFGDVSRLTIPVAVDLPSPWDGDAWEVLKAIRRRGRPSGGEADVGRRTSPDRGDRRLGVKAPAEPAESRADWRGGWPSPAEYRRRTSGGTGAVRGVR